MVQGSFFAKEKTYFGGALLSGKRKSRRPISKKEPIHLVLKTKRSVLFRNRKLIHDSIKKYSKKFGIRIYRQSVQKDHIHLNVRVQSRTQYAKFVRATTSILARKIGRGIWKFRPFTRIGKWGKDFRIIQKYIEQNEKEVFGLIPYKPRKKIYAVNSS